MPMSTPAERERFADVLKKVQELDTSGIPRGLEDVSKAEIPKPVELA